MITNIHTHIFTFSQVPEKFIPGQKFFFNYAWQQKLLVKILQGIPILKRFQKIERLALFLKKGTYQSQEEIFKKLTAYYPSSTRFGVHSMDFESMGAGKCKQGYGFEEQIKELAALKENPEWSEKILPFICVDPRRKGIVELAKDYIENKGFAGVKMYPALGYYPNDERLAPLFAWLEKKGIPIMVHCSRSGPVYGRTDLEDLDRKKLWGNSRKDWANEYTNPGNYIEIFEKYPKIKICFAHFGGDTDCMEYYKEAGDNKICKGCENKACKKCKEDINWFLFIVDMLEKYEGAYADISYSAGDDDLTALFTIYAKTYNAKTPYQLGDKILFGSDYYMAHMTRNERWFSINVRATMGEETFGKISETNINNFLKRSE